MILRAIRPWLLPREKIGVRRFRNSAIVIPNSVPQTRPSDFINSIKPIDRGDFDKDHAIVLFLTPAFASWLHDDHSFLRPAVERAFKNVFQEISAPKTTVVSALVAIVDKLPIPTSYKSQPGHDIIDDGSKRASSVSPWNYIGYDGFAYATVPTEDIQCQEATEGKALGSIGFATAPYTSGLPLANTIFQTGSPTTMFWTEWRKSDTSQDIQLVSQKVLTSAVLKTDRTAIQGAQSSASSVPLIPLTPPRIVETSMGNIVRRIRSEEGKSMTASEELESVIPQYFKARNEAPRAMSVWALVIPKDRLQVVKDRSNRWLDRFRGETPYETFWTDDFPEPRDVSIAQDSPLSYGAHLRKVLSGGGGWGKKAGLLSLDPSPAGEEVTRSPTQDDEDIEDLATALGQVVEPGDSIQFFTTPPAQGLSIDNAEPNMQSVNECVEMEEQPSTLAFGTIPSTVDADEAGSWQHKATDTKRIYKFSNFFGALTEGGMTLKYPEQQRQTKLDVPYSRISVSDVCRPSGTETEVGDAVSPFSRSLSSEIPFRTTLRTSEAPFTPLIRRLMYRTPVSRASPKPPASAKPPVSPEPSAPQGQTDRISIRKLDSTPLIRRLMSETAVPRASAKPPISREPLAPQGQTDRTPIRKLESTRRIRRVMWETQEEATERRQRETLPEVRIREAQEEATECCRRQTLPEVRIRRYVQDHIPESILFERRLRGIQEVVSNQVEQHLFPILKTYIFRHAYGVSDTVDNLLDTGNWTIRRYRQRHREWIRSLRKDLRTSDAEIQALHTELVKTLLSISRYGPSGISNAKVDAQIDAQIDAISLRTYRLQDEVDAVLGQVNHRAALAAATNNSAIDTYLLHTIVRKWLSALAWDYDRPVPQMRILADKLKQLSEFNRNLFVYFRPRERTFVQDRLMALQEQFTLDDTLKQLRRMRAPKDIFQGMGPPGRIHWDGREIRTVGYVHDPRIIYYEPRKAKSEAEVTESKKELKGTTKTSKKRQAKKELWEEISSWLA